MEKFEYSVVFGKSVKDLLRGVKKSIDEGYYPHGSLVYVDLSKPSETISNDYPECGFYQPMVKEKLSDFNGDFIT